MPTIKKQVFIDVELSWAEEQLASWKKYIDDNPIDKLTDRKDIKGKVIQNIEGQIKSIRDTMKEYLSLLKQVDEMRAVEDKKKEARGGGDVPFRMTINEDSNE